MKFLTTWICIFRSENSDWRPNALRASACSPNAKTGAADPQQMPPPPRPAPGRPPWVWQKHWRRHAILGANWLPLCQKQIHALVQAVVFKHQRIAHHDARHARIALGKLQQHGEHAAQFVRRFVRSLGDLIEQTEHTGFDEFDQALEHLRLAGEMAVERGFADLELGGQCRGGDPIEPGCSNMAASACSI